MHGALPSMIRLVLEALKKWAQLSCSIDKVKPASDLPEPCSKAAPGTCLQMHVASSSIMCQVVLQISLRYSYKKRGFYRKKVIFCP